MPTAFESSNIARSSQGPIGVIAWALFTLLVSSLSAQELTKESVQKTALKKFAYSSEAMGVQLNIVVYCIEDDVADTIKAAVEAVSKVNEVFSDYSKDSEVGQLNAMGGDWVATSSSFLELFERCKELTEKTQGNFDVTLGALTHQWRKARKQGRLPDDLKLKDALSVSGVNRIKLRSGSKAIRRPNEIRYPIGLKFDFGGIGKGYAADLAMAEMRRRGYGSALVDLGGDIAVGDPPVGKPGWKVAIAMRPESSEDKSSTPEAAKPRYIEVANCGVATSGDVEQFVEVDGIRYSHLLDPKTGLGIKRQANITIVANDAATADALASAYSVMPFDDANKNRESFEHVELLVQEVIDNAIQERQSENFPAVIK